MAGNATSAGYYDFKADTPESTRARRKMIDAMLEQAVTYKPLGHWTAAAAQGLQGIFGGLGLKDLQDQETAEKGAGVSRFSNVFGGGDAASGSGSSAEDVTSPTRAGGGGQPVPAEPPPVTPPAPRALTPPAPRAPVAMPSSPAPAANAGQVVGYDYAGPMVNGDRPHGKYGVMGANIGPWTKEALGSEMTPADFLSNPQAQDAVAKQLGLEPVPVALAGAPAAPAARAAAPATSMPPAPISAAGGLPTGMPAASPVAAGAPPAAGAPGGADKLLAAAEAQGTARPPAPLPIAEFLSQAGKRNPQLLALAVDANQPPHVKAWAQEQLAKEALALREAASPSSAAELATRAKGVSEAHTAASEAELKKADARKNRTPQESAATVTGVMQDLRQLPVDYGKEAFERGLGPYITTQDKIYENPMAMISGQVARGASEVKAAITGGARPTEVADAVGGLQAQIVSILGPTVRAPGAQSNYELQQIESQAGQLTRSTNTEDYNRRIDRLEQSIERWITRFADPVKIMHTQAGPRSPNAPSPAAPSEAILSGVENVGRSAAAALPSVPSAGDLGARASRMFAPAPQPQDVFNRDRKGDKLKRVMMGGYQ